MEQLIPVINKLQDVFHTVGQRDILQLPQIVVVGSQSSGKSSVLENLVGQDCLPRGTGIVTRVPLIMQLNHVPPVGQRAEHMHLPAAEQWATFLHVPDKVFTDFDLVRDEISAQTVRLTGPNKNILDKPINMKIFSPHVLDLTLVDLPGLTKVPVDDQPDDIEHQTRELILRYVRNPNSIILAVSPATVDIANSESLKLAREVDRDFNRTIGVVTKVDLMDKGTSALDLLAGKVFPLKLGMVGIINRSQLDINQGKSISDALDAEQAFFTLNYPSLKQRCGTSFLAKSLNKLLLHHIRTCLPELKLRIRELQAGTQAMLAEFGEVGTQGIDKGGFMLQVLNDYANTFSASIDGRTSRLPSNMDLCGGAMICHIFHNVFMHSLEGIDALEGLSAQEIKCAIRNATGTRPSLFVPEASFELLAKRQIALLEAPGLRCVELVFEELERLMHRCAGKELARFPALRSAILEVVHELLRARLPATNAMVESLIAIELSYINTSHPEFEGFSGVIAKMVNARFAEASAAPPLHVSGASLPSSLASGTGASAAAAGKHPLATGTTASTVSAVGAPKILSAAEAVAVAPRFSAAQDVPPSPEVVHGVLDYLPFFNRAKPAKKQRVLDSPSIRMAPMSEDYAGLGAAPELTFDQHSQSNGDSMNEREQLEVEFVQSLIRSYLSIVKKNVQDSIPKACMHFLVSHVQSRIQNELVSRLYKRELFEALLAEDPVMAQQRARAAEMLAALNRASLIVAEVSEASMM